MHVFSRLTLKPLFVLLINVVLTTTYSNVCAQTATIVKTMPPEHERDYRHRFKLAVLRAALEETRKEFGGFKVNIPPGYMTALRAFRELDKKEGVVNTIFAITTKEREANSIAIRIPIRRGLLGYRLLLVKKERAELISKIRTLSELKERPVGMENRWVTARVAESHKFNVIYAIDRDSLFKMLDKGRFDYVVMGINEIYKEFENRNLEQSGFVVAPNIALQIAMPLYIFVSRHEPEIARRIELGLEALIASGKYEGIFLKEYGEFIRKANLSGRHIINIPNPHLPSSVPSARKELWYMP